MGTANLPQLPPQSVPPLDERGGDTSLPPLLSRVWWLFFNSLVNSVGAFIAKLTTPGAIPKVTAAGVLGESAISDDGTTVKVASRVLKVSETISGAALPTVELEAVGVTDKTRYTRTSAAVPRADILVNVSFDGTNFNLDDITKPGLRISFNTSSGILFATFSAGANPRSSTIEFTVDPTGNVNAVGVYKVAGTQVVGAQLAAITSPTGGGTSVSAASGGGTSVSAASGGGTFVSAPSGGTVIDVQARTAISAIISAISSAGNTVDPAARTAIASIISAISSAGNTVDPAARTAIASIITAISSSGNTVDPAARTAIDAIRSRLSTHGLTS
jgi:hypothetical protein